MKRKGVFLIAAGVIAAHAIVFYLIAGKSPLPKVPYIPPDNFSLGWAKFTDPATHEKMVYQEFTVSTQMEKPEASPAETGARGRDGTHGTDGTYGKQLSTRLP